MPFWAGLDVALVPIGDRYTMGPADAVEALNFLRPKLAVPMHYDTTDKIRQNPHAFAATALAAGHTVFAPIALISIAPVGAQEETLAETAGQEATAPAAVSAFTL